MGEISEIVLSGALGLLNFWVLRERNILYFFNTKDSTEKNHFIIILGLFNFVVYDLLEKFTDGEWNNYLLFLVTFVSAIVIEIIIIKAVNFIMALNNKRKKKNNELRSYYIHTLDKTLSNSMNENLYAYIFDFSNNIIEHGFIDDWNTDSDEFNMVFQFSPDHHNLAINHDELMEFLSDKNYRVTTYIDYTHNVKMYFYDNSVEKEE